MTELQKKADSFESELMQERMSHVNTRDELETLRKQMDTVKEEMANEKEGVESRVEAMKSGMEAQLAVKNEVTFPVDHEIITFCIINLIAFLVEQNDKFK